MQDINQSDDRLEQATRARLAKLASVPVDTLGLQQRLKEVLETGGAAPVHRHMRWWQPISAVAAAVGLVAVVGLVVINLSSSPAIASTAELARLHGLLINDSPITVAARDMEQARQIIGSQWAKAPAIPVPEVGQVTACCRHNLQNRKVACVVLRYMDTQVTMAVGRSRDLTCSADHKIIERDGHTYFVYSQDGLQMVMMQRSGRWVCLMSHLSIDDLMGLADRLKF